MHTSVLLILTFEHETASNFNSHHCIYVTVTIALILDLEKIRCDLKYTQCASTQSQHPCLSILIF
jgi:hypothetical protein